MLIKSGVGNESIKYEYGNHKGGIKERSDEQIYLSSKSICVNSAKNDFVAFQVFVKADEDFILCTTNNTNFSEYGCITIVRLDAVLNSKEIKTEMFAVGLVEDDDRCLKSDILLNNEYIFVQKDTCQPIWVEMKIPKDFNKRKLEGKILLYSHKMFEDEIKIDSLNFNINIIDVVLPDPKDFKFCIDLWLHLSNIARQHEVKLWSDEHFKIIEEYIKTLAELGQKVITLIVSEIPWSGQRCYMVKSHLSNLFEYNIIKVKKIKNGKLSLDFKYLDRLIDLCFKYNINKEIELIGLLGVWSFPKEGFGNVIKDYSDAIRIRFYDENKGAYCFIDNKEELSEYIKGVKEYFVKKGLIKKLRLSADEPTNDPTNLKKFKEWVNYLKSISPFFKIKVYISNISFKNYCKNVVDDVVFYIETIIENKDFIQNIKDKSKGKVHWYTCCGQFPDSCIRANLLESRFIGWLTEYLGLEGFMRWNYTAWPENPREKIYWNAPLFPAGENNFVYPNRNGSPLLSIRYKNLLRGIQDFELMQMLKNVHPRKETVLNELFNKIIKVPDLYNPSIFEEEKNKIISLNYEEYDDSRKVLLEEIRKYT